METANLISTAEISIDAPAEKVWSALTDGAANKQFMFGADVVSNWTEGSAITWSGEFKGKSYHDKGTILKAVPNETLQYTHFSSMLGKEDKPENYHTVTIQLKETDGKTQVSLAQDKNASEEERMHSAENWKMMLEGLKKVVE
jgi:uncharacterized protein YndB with AHSA1/START domain